MITRISLKFSKKEGINLEKWTLSNTCLTVLDTSFLSNLFLRKNPKINFVAEESLHHLCQLMICSKINSLEMMRMNELLNTIKMISTQKSIKKLIKEEENNLFIILAQPKNLQKQVTQEIKLISQNLERYILDFINNYYQKVLLFFQIKKKTIHKSKQIYLQGRQSETLTFQDQIYLKIMLRDILAPAFIMYVLTQMTLSSFYKIKEEIYSYGYWNNYSLDTQLYLLPTTGTMISDIILTKETSCPELYSQFVPSVSCDDQSQEHQTKEDSSVPIHQRCYKQEKEKEQLIEIENQQNSEKQSEYKICVQYLESANYRSQSYEFDISNKVENRCVYQDSENRGYVTSQSACYKESSKQVCGHNEYLYQSQFLISCVHSDMIVSSKTKEFECNADETPCSEWGMMYCVKKPYKCPVLDVELAADELSLEDFEQYQLEGIGYFYIQRNNILKQRVESLFISDYPSSKSIKVFENLRVRSSNLTKNAKDKYIQIPKALIKKNYCYHSNLSEVKGQVRNDYLFYQFLYTTLFLFSATLNISLFTGIIRIGEYPDKVYDLLGNIAACLFVYFIILIITLTLFAIFLGFDDRRCKTLFI